MSKKVLFCGGGNMAEGVLRSVLKKGVVEREQVTVNDLVQDRCSYLEATYGVKAVVDGLSLIHISIILSQNLY